MLVLKSMRHETTCLNIWMDIFYRQIHIMRTGKIWLYSGQSSMKYEWQDNMVAPEQLNS